MLATRSILRRGAVGSTILRRQNAQSTVQLQNYFVAAVHRAPSPIYSTSGSSNYATNHHHRQHTTIIQQSPLTFSSTRTYVSRAHPKPKPFYPVPRAIDQVLQGAEDRKIRKEKTRWERFPHSYPEEKRVHPDEGVDVVVGLNVDPRQPNQSLRGSIRLPHGTGKTLNCMVFSEEEEIVQLAKAMGAVHAGGSELIDAISKGEIALQTMDRAFATPEIQAALGKSLSRVLGPRGLMPNPKTGSIVQNMAELRVALENNIQGKEVVYRTEKEGVVHLGIGRVSFGREKLVENLAAVMHEMYAAKPERYGKGNKSKAPTGKGVKYILYVGLSSTQGKGFKVSLETVDPNGPFFMKDPNEALSAALAEEAA